MLVEKIAPVDALTSKLSENPTPPLRAVSALDAESFSRRLAETSPAESISPWGNQQTAAAPADDSAASMSIGDTVLSGLRHVGNELHGKWQGMTSSTHDIDKPLTVSDMLRTQVQLSALVLQTEFASAVVKKASTAVDQLVHMQ